MRPARFLVLPFVAAALPAGGCGGGQATAPADPGTLLSEAGAAASGKHSARFQVVVEGMLVHRHPLPAGTSAGPYDLVIRAASTGDGGGMTDVTVGRHQPGGTMTFDIQEIGTKLPFEVPGGQWYSEQIGGLATATPQGSGSAGAMARCSRRAGRRGSSASAPAGTAGSTRSTGSSTRGRLDRRHRLLRQLRVPRRDLGLARADLTFRPDILLRYGVPQPFGLPRAAAGLRLTLSAHLTHWGGPVRIAPPKRATPLPNPGLPSPAI